MKKFTLSRFGVSFFSACMASAFTFNQITEAETVPALANPTQANPAHINPTEVTPEEKEEPAGIVVSAPRSANQEPAGAISTLISAFRYDPQVDLQDRNLAEAQSDATIRGGTFDMTGITIGAASIYDPQTGHYTADLPIPPAFLSSASVLTGSDNALSGFNTTAGSIYSGFAPAETWNIAKVGIGDFGTNIQELTTDNAKVLQGDLGDLAIGTNFAHSTSNGTREFGDSEFFRYAARAQLSDGKSRQTDLLYSYQSKDFRWPNLYALQELHDLLGSSGIESESIDTALVMLNHRTKFSKTGNLEFTSYYKRNHDDYEFDDFNKDLFNPYRHTTKVYGAGVQGSEQFGAYYSGVNGQIYGDQIESTSLTFGDYDSRTLAKLSTYVGRKMDLNRDLVLDPFVGVSWDKSDRTSEHVAPIAKVNLTQSCEDSERSVYAEYSGSSQLPGYTALNSNPSAGLFRGNKSLKRQRSANTEVGYEYQQEGFYLNTALFYRKDDDLTDWTYSSITQPYAARSANNVDISTRGAEVYGAVSKGRLTFSNSYALLDNHADYEIEGIDASFYALNYPAHRVTSSLIANPTQEIEVRGDLEFRKQYQNALRESEDTTYIISSLSASYQIPQIIGLNLSAIVDNIGNEQFEEVPGVPGAGRMATVVANYVW